MATERFTPPANDRQADRSIRATGSLNAGELYSAAANSESTVDSGLPTEFGFKPKFFDSNDSQQLGRKFDDISGVLSDERHSGISQADRTKLAEAMFSGITDPDSPATRIAELETTPIEHKYYGTSDKDYGEKLAERTAGFLSIAREPDAFSQVRPSQLMSAVTSLLDTLHQLNPDQLSTFNKSIAQFFNGNRGNDTEHRGNDNEHRGTDNEHRGTDDEHRGNNHENHHCDHDDNDHRPPQHTPGKNEHPKRPHDGGNNEHPKRPHDGGNDEHPKRPHDGGKNEHPKRPHDGGDTHSGDYKPTNGKTLYALDFSGGKDGNVNVVPSIDDNHQNFGGSHIGFKKLPDGKEVVNFKVNRWPDLPDGWEKNPPANVSDAEIARLKHRQSYRAELANYATEDRLQPGHSYEVNFSNQLVDWDTDPSAWGDTFLQLRQSNNTGVPELALGTHQGKYGVLVDGKWHDVDLPPVDQTIGEWHDWTMRLTVQNADGTGGHLEFLRDGKPFFEIPNYKLKHGLGEGNPYLKFGVYKAVYHEGDDPKKGTDTQGNRYREVNFDNFDVTDTTR